jgi:hypothetical protein
VLLVTGTLLVFAGLSAALGFTPVAMLVSVAAIATLLYAGGAWFGPLAPQMLRDPVVVFDRSLRVVCGVAAGRPVGAQFPRLVRRDVEVRCAAVLTGQWMHMTCEEDGVTVAIAAAPVCSADGAVLYGILISGTAAPASAAAACIAS